MLCKIEEALHSFLGKPSASNLIFFCFQNTYQQGPNMNYEL
jgi:hypothetical protein